MSSDVPRRRKSDRILPKADLSQPALHTAKELRRWIRVLAAATVVLYIVMLSVATYTYVQGLRNTRALCTIRDNAQDRADTGRQFLIDHPNGIAGLSADDIERSINTSLATVKALDDVDCPPKPPAP